MKRQFPKARRSGAADAVQEAGAERQDAAPGEGADDRGSAPHRQAAHPQGGVRLHRRRRRGRAVARPRAAGVRATSSSTRRSCATCPTVDTGWEVLGAPVALPFGIAPTGFTRMMQTEGEIAGARAAGRAGIPFSLSTMGTTSIEDVGARQPARPQLVSALHVEGPRPVDGAGRARRRGRATTPCWSPSTCRWPARGCATSATA